MPSTLLRTVRAYLVPLALLAAMPNVSHGQLASAPNSAGVDLEAHRIGGFGIDLSGRDPAIRPGDDFFMSQNGAWYAKAAIPATITAAGY